MRPAYSEGIGLFGNILHHVIAQESGQFVLKFWAKIRRDSRGSCKLNITGYEKGLTKLNFLATITGVKC